LPPTELSVLPRPLLGWPGLSTVLLPDMPECVLRLPVVDVLEPEPWISAALAPEPPPEVLPEVPPDVPADVPPEAPPYAPPLCAQAPALINIAASNTVHFFVIKKSP
jgi:hypothetical protein